MNINVFQGPTLKTEAAVKEQSPKGTPAVPKLKATDTKEADSDDMGFSVPKLVTSGHDVACSGKLPSDDEEKPAVVKVEPEEVVEVKALDEAFLSAGVKSSFGADASVLERAQHVCQCREMKVVGTVRKEGFNKGRKFFTCPKKLQPGP